VTQISISRAHSAFHVLASRPIPTWVLLKTLRRLSPEVMEGVLSHLQGGALLAVALAYGLGVRLESLRHVRLRDVYLSSKSIDIQGERYVIPDVLVCDLRDFLHEQVCGSGGASSIHRREQPLFSEEVFAAVWRHTASCIERGVFNWLHPECATLFAGVVSERFVSICISFLSREHSKRVVMPVAANPRRRGAGVIRSSSPLELFEKGPLIVRRARSGTKRAYYLWRFVTAGDLSVVAQQRKVGVRSSRQRAAASQAVTVQ
jgi:hypothetical protein